MAKIIYKTMTTKRKWQPPKERKKQSHGIRMYDDDHTLAIKEHGSLQKFVDDAVVILRRNKGFGKSAITKALTI